MTMSSITCIIDFSVNRIPAVKIPGQQNQYCSDTVLLSVGANYHGKYLWVTDESRFLLLIGTAFLNQVHGEAAGLVRTKRQLEQVMKRLEEGHLPENLLTGFYNLISVDVVQKRAFIHSAHFGMRPLFYSSAKNLYLVSTHPESIVATGLVEGKTRFSTALQFFAFNYVLNDDTLFKNVQSLPGGARLWLSPQGTSIEKYFKSASLITKPIYSYRDAVHLIQAELTHVIDKYTRDISTFSLSLTGGWDGRLILAMLRKKNVTINAYSHGTPVNPDVLIPQQIADQLGIRYTAYLLDDRYYEEKFFDYAVKTVEKSAGMRSLARAHYLFSVGSELVKSSYVLTGICGSNLMKGNIVPGPVTNANVLKLIYERDFGKCWAFMETSCLDKISNTISIPKEEWDSFRHLVSQVHTLYHQGDVLESRLYEFIFDLTERGYFGTEIMTYSDLGETLSPFIDIEFVKTLCMTPYFGAYQVVKKKNIFANWRNSLLYAHMINTSYPELGKIPSDKGVSLYDLSKVHRWPWVARQQIRKRSPANKVDHYDHTKGMEKIVASVNNSPLIKSVSSLPTRLDKELDNNMITFLLWTTRRDGYC